ncbi:MAG: hypothetical protein DMF50_04885 [Acidobacteria bacterium]|nr:MAG: hypothetical protein DMF50_04885 [Acidobacteriota bacterium]
MISAAPAHCAGARRSPRIRRASSRVPSGSKVLRTAATWGPTRFRPATNRTSPTTVASRTIPRTAPQPAAVAGRRKPPWSAAARSKAAADPDTIRAPDSGVETPGVRRCIQTMKAAYQKPARRASATPAGSVASPSVPAHR